MAWRSWFPFSSYRKFQEETLCRIVEAFEKRKYVILQAPCGSGKSASGVAIGTYYKQAWICTVQKQLQDQYLASFPDHLALLKGKSNYDCTFDWMVSGRGVDHSCATAPCGVNLPSKEAKQISAACAETHSCPYLNAKVRAYGSPMALLNFSNLLAFSALDGLPKRPILILDEAHALQNELYKFAEIGIFPDAFAHVQHLLSADDLHNITRGFQSPEDVVDFCGGRLGRCRAYVDREVENLSGKGGDLDHKLVRAKRYFDRLAAFVKEMEDGVPYVVKKAAGGCKLSPLRVSHLHGLAFKAGEKVLLMSGTILDPEKYAETLGITDYEYIDVPSTFPPENGPIIVYPVGSMSYKNLEGTWPKAVQVIKGLAKYHANEKGVIQTYNYAIAQRLQAAFGDDRRFLIQTSLDVKQDLLARHLSSPEPTVLVGPGYKEGLDFRDALCRWQVIVKLPFADLKDPVIALMSKLDPDWYSWITALDLLQMLGRPLRSETDEAVQYILDGYMPGYYSRYKRFFPKSEQARMIFK